MKYLKTFNENMNRSEIAAKCKKYHIINYTINDDGTIDVDGYVNLSKRGLVKLPLRFRNVSGNFLCQFNRLTTLDGAPQKVGGNFDCQFNQLTNLEGLPKYIGNNIYTDGNKIKNIDNLSNHYKKLCIAENPIWNILKLFTLYDRNHSIKNTKENKDLLYDFREREIIQNDILILDRLVDFLEDVGKPKTKKYLHYLLKNIYKIR